MTVIDCYVEDPIWHLQFRSIPFLIGKDFYQLQVLKQNGETCENFSRKYVIVSIFKNGNQYHKLSSKTVKVLFELSIFLELLTSSIVKMVTVSE